jgi:hypothetical protein
MVGSTAPDAVAIRLIAAVLRCVRVPASQSKPVTPIDLRPMFTGGQDRTNRAA